MYLIEILLPLQDESRKPFPAEPYGDSRSA